VQLFSLTPTPRALSLKQRELMMKSLQ